MNGVIIQHAYPNQGFEKMLSLTMEHNAAYCKKYDFDYVCNVSESATFPMSAGAWVKIELIRDALNKGYEYVAWLDADAMIVDTETDLREAFQPGKIGACWHRIPQLHHWNVGVLYVHNTPDTKAFISQWLASYPPPADGWFEQGVFNRLALKSRIVSTISDKWNATINVNVVPDAVVLGFHGQGDSDYRYKLMEDTFISAFPNEKAMTQGNE